MVLLTEYFSSGLPRSRWNCMCNRLTGEKDGKDKAEKGGVGEEDLQVMMKIWRWQEETRGRISRINSRVLRKSWPGPWVKLQGLRWRNPTSDKNDHSSVLTLWSHWLGEAWGSTASMWMPQWRQRFGSWKLPVVCAPAAHSLAGSSEGCLPCFGKSCL